MLKPLLSVGIALTGTLFTIVLYWFIFMPWLMIPGVISPWPKLILAMVSLGVAVYLFMRSRSWPALLLLVGSIPVLLVNISMCGCEWRIQRIYGPNPHEDSALLAFLFASDSERSPINAILHYLIFVSMVCLPIAFFWYFFRVCDQHLTKRWSEPRTATRQG